MSALPFSSLTPRAWGLLAALLTLLLYIQAADYPFVNWDDTEYVELNLGIRHLDTHSILGFFRDFRMGFWIPLTWLSLALDFWVARLAPWIYHLDNLLLHILNTYLVFDLVHRLLRSRTNAPGGMAASKPLTAAFITSLLFGFHPLHVESVAWVSERKDVLYSFFWLLSLRSYLGYTLDPEHRLRNYGVSLFFFILSLMAKPMALSLPFVLLYMDHWPLERWSQDLRKVLLEKLPFLAATVAAGLLALHSQAQAGALWDLRFLSLSQRLMNAGHSILFYLEKTLFPTGLAAFYPLLPDQLFDTAHWASVLAFLALTAATVLFRKSFPLGLAAWAFFLLTLFPALGLFQAGNQAAADRFTYIPSLAPFLLLSLGLAHGLSRSPRLFLPLTLVVMAVLGTLTLHQASLWKDPVTLWEKTLERYPQNNLAVHYNLGRAYEMKGRYVDALKKYDDSLSPNAGFFYPYWGKGRVLAAQGDWTASIENYRRAIALVPRHPSLHAELGLVLQNRGQGDEALQELRRALQLDDHFSDGYAALGTYYRKRDRWEGAMACFETAWFLDPDNPSYFKDLMEAYGKAGRTPKALEGYRKIARDPRSLLSLDL